MHPEVKARISAALDTLLSSTFDSYPPVFPSGLRECSAKIAELLGRVNRGAIEDGDIFLLLMRKILPAVNGPLGDEHRKKFLRKSLKDVLGVDEALELKQWMLDVLFAYPSVFEFTFPVPRLPIYTIDRFLISSDAEFLCSHTTEQMLGLSDTDMIRGMGVNWFLVIRQPGFFSTGKDQQAFVEAFEKFKRVIFLFRIFGVLQPIYDLFEVSADLKRVDVKSDVVDEEAYDKFVNLPYAHSEYLGRVGFALPSDGVSDDLQEDERRRIKYLSDIASACERHAKQLKHVFAACEWGLEAQVEANQTFSFIKTCIGLEALHGDGNKDEKERSLSDRYAYSLGVSPTDREEIKDLFRILYKKRSILVHGSASRLSRDDLKIAHQAEQLLWKAIIKEFVSVSGISPFLMKSESNFSLKLSL